MYYNEMTAAASAIQRGDGSGQSMPAAKEIERVAKQLGHFVESARDKPMLEVEYDQLEQAALELDQSVQWLIQRIQPICQPNNGTKAVEGNSCGEPASPSSEMRTKLRNLRGTIEHISSRIAEVRYTIEV